MQITLPLPLIVRLKALCVSRTGLVPRDVVQACLETPKTLGDFERNGK